MTGKELFRELGYEPESRELNKRVFLRDTMSAFRISIVTSTEPGITATMCKRDLAGSALPLTPREREAALRVAEEMKGDRP